MAGIVLRGGGRGDTMSDAFNIVSKGSRLLFSKGMLDHSELLNRNVSFLEKGRKGGIQNQRLPLHQAFNSPKWEAISISLQWGRASNPPECGEEIERVISRFSEAGTKAHSTPGSFVRMKSVIWGVKCEALLSLPHSYT